MSDRKAGSTPSHMPDRLALARQESEGSADHYRQQPPGSGPDLNALLAQEQTAIMTAEATSDEAVRDEQREIARQARGRVDLTPFPSREPHDFERPLPAAQSGRSGGMEQVVAEFDALQQQVFAMEKEMGTRYSEGRMGTKHNTYEHRSRLIRQARGRLHDLRAS
jgi:hypothetical protein